MVEVNGVPSSYQHPDPRHLVFEYMRWMQTALRETISAGILGGDRDHLEIAHLGGGGCSLPRAFAAEHPRSRQVVVELDGDLAELARTWFDLPRSPGLRIRAEDAAVALSGWRDDRFDVIVRDVFAGDRTPPQLCGAGAASHAARVLRAGGIYLANCAGEPSGRTAMADELVTLRTAFPFVGIIAENGVLAGRRKGNTVLVASDTPLVASIDRALRSDAVAVRWMCDDDLARLAAVGRVLAS